MGSECSLQSRYVVRDDDDMFPLGQTSFSPLSLCQLKIGIYLVKNSLSVQNKLTNKIVTSEKKTFLPPPTCISKLNLLQRTNISLVLIKIEAIVYISCGEGRTSNRRVIRFVFGWCPCLNDLAEARN